MAHGDREIEIKIPLDRNAFLSVKERLQKSARYEKTSQQRDEYFTPAHRNFVGPPFPFEWLSLRERAGKFIINYKHFYPENAETTTHCDEFEAEVKDKGKMEKIFAALDFKRLVAVEKEREVYVMGDKFEIALDTVRDLGHFVEIEAMKDLGSVEETRERLFACARSLGIDPSRAEKRGYPFLLMRKKGLLK